MFRFPYQLRRPNDGSPLARYCLASRVPEAICERFIDRLQAIRFEPSRLLEIGSAGGHLRRQLRQRYPDCEIISMESDKHFCLQDGPSPWKALQRLQPILCAHGSSIPLPSASVDMVALNLAWVDASEVSQVVSECTRVLRASGLLIAVSYGPETLRELREAWAALDSSQHSNQFMDMHDLGDEMVRSTLSDVVADSERLLVEFDDVNALLRELKHIGGGNRAKGKRRGLTTQSMLSTLAAHYPLTKDHIVASVELVFAHAWLLERPGKPVSAPFKQ